MLKKLSCSIFCATVYLFSSALLVISLLMSVRMTAMWDEVTAARSTVDRLREENALLLSKYENSISLEKIEYYAKTYLGMSRCTNEQIEYIYIK